MKTIFPDEIPEEMEDLREGTDSIEDSLKPILETDEKLRKLSESRSSTLGKLTASSSMLSAFQGYCMNSIFRGFGELAISNAIPKYSFTNPVLQQLKENYALNMAGMHTATSALGDYLHRNQEQFRSITDSLRAISESYGNAISNLVKSPVFEWLNTLDVFPIHSILENLNLPEDGLLGRYDKLKEVYLTTFMECKWFPYAAWAADLNLFAEVSDIMATSRGASKRREKRIDQAILAYYDKAEVKAIKRNWKQMDMENHIKGGEARGKDKNIDRQIENKFNAFKAYAAKHNLHWGFVRDKDNQLYINNTEFAEDMADEHWVPLTQEF